MSRPDSDDLGLSPEFADLANLDSCYERFEPIGNCVICEEPSERLYQCAHCGSSLCPVCVCGVLDKPVSKVALCPSCPGAVYPYDPDWAEPDDNQLEDLSRIELKSFDDPFSLKEQS